MDADSSTLVEQVLIEFRWNPGMAPSQKQKNIVAMHEAAADRGLGPVLEVSSKSLSPAGVALSAFNLKLGTETFGEVTVEAAFQASKVFEGGGPHPDMLQVSGRELKRDPRLMNSGRLVAFEWEGVRWPLFPRTAFYDWLYISALLQHTEMAAHLDSYQSFTDIEFNPAKAINCQAGSCALFAALKRRDVDFQLICDPEAFIRTAYPPEPISESISQSSLF